MADLADELEPRWRNTQPGWTPAPPRPLRPPPDPKTPACPRCGLRSVRWAGCTHTYHEENTDAP